MSKTPLDSDLYGDIYGEEDNEYAVPLQEQEEEGEPDPAQEPKSEEVLETSVDTKPQTAPPIVSQEAHRSLPPKPSPHSPTSLSYSAQIAQQFSAYQQTPSQERQQRAEIPLPQNPRIAATPGASAIATHEGSNTGKTDSVFGKKPSEMHDAGKMFIGGLNWDTTDEGLRNYFSEFGKVDACTIMRDPSGTSRGFAFLTFEDPASVNAVVVREHFLDGKAIDPKRAIPREEHLRNTRYFVGGLAPTTTSDSMREFFAAYGKVVDATVMLDRESGRSKGFGFVTFEDANNADQLVGKIGLVLDDKQIEVKTAQPRSQRDQTRSTAVGGHSQQETFSHDQDRILSPNLPFIAQQQNPMTSLYQRSMGQQMPMMMGGPMMNMNMNPMAMAMGMGMGMNPYNPMANMNGMNMMGGMNNPGNLGAMRLGMGPMGMMAGNTPTGINAIGGMGGMGMGMMGTGMGTGMGMRQPQNAMNHSLMRAPMNTAGLGPSRVMNRGQHNFHPYAR